jgi:hypothetical protein
MDISGRRLSLEEWRDWTPQGFLYYKHDAASFKLPATFLQLQSHTALQTTFILAQDRH